jgi:hypothetical protein
MEKQEILAKLEMCISILENSENTYVCNQLEKISKALTEEWSNSYVYEEEVKKVLNYDETINNLNKIW